MDELFDLFLTYIPTTNLVAPHMRFWPNGGGAIMAYTDKTQAMERVVAEWTSVDNGVAIITALLHDPNATAGIELPATAPSINEPIPDRVYYNGSHNPSRYISSYGGNPVREIKLTNDSTKHYVYDADRFQPIIHDFDTQYEELHTKLLKKITGE